MLSRVVTKSFWEVSGSKEIEEIFCQDQIQNFMLTFFWMAPNWNPSNKKTFPGVGNITLCPLCDNACSYQKLGDSCGFSQITYLFDNPATVFFAIFMSLWATTFLELWKRKQSIIVWEWDLHNVENDEEPRPEFETSVKTFRTNPVTREKEAFIPQWWMSWSCFWISLRTLISGKDISASWRRAQSCCSLCASFLALFSQPSCIACLSWRWFTAASDIFLEDTRSSSHRWLPLRSIWFS